MNDPKIVAALKAATGATAVRMFPTGQGDGYALTQDGQGVRFVDEKGAAHFVSMLTLGPAPADPAQKPGR